MKRILTACAVLTAFISLTSFAATDRFPEMPLDQMNPAQRKVAEAIIAGPRKSLSGPFNTWLRSPDLADRLQSVGEYIRYKSSLSRRLNEFAILIIAREWTAQFQWFSHYQLAIDAGLKPEIAAAVAAGKRPTGMSADETVVYDATLALHRNKGQIPDALFEQARKMFGEQGVVDLIGVNGYYTAVAMTLNVAQVPVPAGTPLPLPILK